jgi:uncharacterized protein
MITFVVFVTTFFAALLSSMSGGGTGIIMYPVFLTLGIPYPMVSATQSMMSAFWVLPASGNYLKGRTVDWTFVVLFSLIGFIGAYAGVLFVTSVDQRLLEIGAGTIILLLVMYMYFRKDVGLVKHHSYPTKRQLFAYLFALPIGFYEVLLGVGNGIAVTVVTIYTKGFDLIDGLGHYYIISFSWAVFAVVLFAYKGYFDLGIMAPAVMGALAGAYIGSKYARFKGNRFIKILFIAFGGILGLKLVLGL